ncbi:hypothetical protein C8Q77DRAFT_1120588 [Trametes polyzona]|nr:hypothetical protein C8Q77DRAFT_1120588 [Trametes polyzona]
MDSRFQLSADDTKYYSIAVAELRRRSDGLGGPYYLPSSCSSTVDAKAGPNKATWTQPTDFVAKRVFVIYRHLHGHPPGSNTALMLSMSSFQRELELRRINVDITHLRSRCAPIEHSKGEQQPLELPDTELSSAPLPAPILRVDHDVFTIIADHLLRRKPSGSLSKLSVCCRRLRELSLPLLFSRCTVFVGSVPAIPPATIRPYVRHLTYVWYWRAVSDQFGTELPYLPSVQSITFDTPAYGVPWEAIQTCRSYPNIKTIVFNETATFYRVPPYPQDIALTTSTFEELSYPSFIKLPLPTKLWKSLVTMDQLRALESACLLPLVLGMHDTARSLALPLETAPIAEMATVDWPSLQRLSLEGSAPSDADRRLPMNMPAMLRRMRRLQSLTLNAALPRSTTGRHRVLGNVPPSEYELSNLRSLVLSHPDPDDNIFSASMPNLLHLSLRDWPRHYDFLALSYYHACHRSPLLTATEMLSVLKRLHLPELRTLELVYRADHVDDDLLRYVVEAFPKLRHLEIHRYRPTPSSVVDYGHIIRIISSLKTLATLRLHLDFEDDPGAYACDLNAYAHTFWLPKLTKRGWDILKMMVDACPELESVALVFFASGPPSTWIWFHRASLAARKPVYNSYPGNCDSMPRPSIHSRRTKTPCSRTCTTCTG